MDEIPLPDQEKRECHYRLVDRARNAVVVLDDFLKEFAELQTKLVRGCPHLHDYCQKVTEDQITERLDQVALIVAGQMGMLERLFGPDSVRVGGMSPIVAYGAYLRMMLRRVSETEKLEDIVRLPGEGNDNE